MLEFLAAKSAELAPLPIGIERIQRTKVASQKIRDVFDNHIPMFQLAYPLLSNSGSINGKVLHK